MTATLFQKFDGQAALGLDEVCNIPGLAVDVERKYTGPPPLDDSERFIVYNYLLDNARSVCTYDDKAGVGLFDEAERYYRCGKDAVSLQCPDCHSRYYIKSWCRSRICDHCAAIYKKKLFKKLMPEIRTVMARKKRGYVVALLTLTISTKRFGPGGPGRSDIDRLYKETSKFFKLHYGKYAGKISKKGRIYENRKRYIGGGWVATLEVGQGNNNLHVHSVVYGPIRQWFKLKSSWEKITGDSMGVDIRKVRGARQVANYVLKYITKPPIDDDLASYADYAVMIKGSRRIRTGGVFYNKLALAKRGGRKCECIYCNSRLVMDGHVLLSEVGNRVDLYNELDQIKKETGIELDTRTELPPYCPSIDPPNPLAGLPLFCN
jgi:hypothetical protein